MQPFIREWCDPSFRSLFPMSSWRALLYSSSPGMTTRHRDGDVSVAFCYRLWDVMWAASLSTCLGLGMDGLIANYAGGTVMSSYQLSTTTTTTITQGNPRRPRIRFTVGGLHRLWIDRQYYVMPSPTALPARTVGQLVDAAGKADEAL